MNTLGGYCEKRRTQEVDISGKDIQVQGCCPSQGDAQPPPRALLVFGRYSRIRVRVRVGDDVNVFEVLRVVN